MKFKVTMHCASCAGNIEKVLSRMGVKSQSNPALKITKIISKPDNVSEEDIIKAIESIGYEAKRA